MDKRTALPIRRKLRQAMTEPEQKLWYRLREVSVAKFRRQHRVGPYIVDFYCAAARLVIEVDGESHFTSSGKRDDLIRDDYLFAQGLNVLRFTNNEVLQNLDGVVGVIAEAANTSNCPSPRPSPRMRGEGV